MDGWMSRCSLHTEEQLLYGETGQLTAFTFKRTFAKIIVLFILVQLKFGSNQQSGGRGEVLQEAGLNVT